MASLQKNVAGQNFTFTLINATSGAAVSGATVTVSVTKDGGAQTSGTGTVTSQGLGQYNYAPAQSETNATNCGFLLTATGVIPVNIDFHPDQVDANGLLKVDVEDINGNATAAQNVSKANQAIGRGTVGGGGGSITNIPTSSFTPAAAGTVANQFVGRTIVFDANTITVALQGQASNITGNTGGITPSFTVGQMTTSPALGDTFGVY